MSGEFPLKIGVVKIKATKAWISNHQQRKLVHFVALLIVFKALATLARTQCFVYTLLVYIDHSRRTHFQFHMNFGSRISLAT